MIHTDTGYYTPVVLPPGASGPLFVHLWYLKDHLGNNRVLADGSGNAVALHDYDPYGEEIAVASSSLPYPLPPGAKDSPYKYGGKEWNETTSTYDFEARYLSPSFHRFTTMDPLAEKYYSISPYAYCANNPANLVDPFGLTTYVVDGMEYVIDDGYDDTVTATIMQYYTLDFLSRTSDSFYDLARYSLMDQNGYSDGEGNQVLAASIVFSDDSTLSGFAASLAGAFSSDLAVTDPTDAYLPKWAVYAISAVGLGAWFYVEKMNQEIERLNMRSAGPYGWQYALLATHDGPYPSYSVGSTGETYLNSGDVWKYGETTRSDRYSQTWLDSHALKMDKQFYGTQREIKIEEKRKIYGYFLSHGHLPPGNKIFR